MSRTTPDHGRDVDAYCSRCKMELAHTITAKDGDLIVRVICNTCKAEHRYRASAGSSAPRRSRATSGARAARQPKTRALRGDFDRLVDGRDLMTARHYSPNETFTMSELIAHPSFGVGVVSVVKAGGKLEVVFPDAVKVRVHARG